MALSPLPPSSDFVTTGETKATFKGALSGLRAFLNSLLGATGSQADALTALGAPLNGTVALTAAATVVAAHRGKALVCSGTWELAIDAIATLGAGFVFVVSNSSTGSITINPNLSEPINGASTFVLGPLQSCAVMADETAAGWVVLLTGGGGGSTGQVAHFAMNAAPPGWLKANGAQVSQTSYAALYAAIGTTFNTGGETAGYFRLPEIRAEGIRGWDDGRGVDSGRALGSWQDGQMPSHSHTYGIGNSGVGATDEVWGTNGAASGIYSAHPATSAVGGTSNSSETRMRNIALLACIKY